MRNGSAAPVGDWKGNSDILAPTLAAKTKARRGWGTHSIYLPNQSGVEVLHSFCTGSIKTAGKVCAIPPIAKNAMDGARTVLVRDGPVRLVGDYKKSEYDNRFDARLYKIPRALQRRPPATPPRSGARMGTRA